MPCTHATTGDKRHSFMDVSAFWNMLNGLGSEFEKLHASHTHLLGSIESKDVLRTTGSPRPLDISTVNFGPTGQLNIGPRGPVSTSIQPDLVASDDMAGFRVELSSVQPGLAPDNEVLGCCVEPGVEADSAQPTKPVRTVSKGSNYSWDSQGAAAGSPPGFVKKLATSRDSLYSITSALDVAVEYISATMSTAMQITGSVGSEARRQDQDRKKARVQEELIAVFNELDIDGTGSLQARSLRVALVAAGAPPARLARLFQLADADNSGSIELDEWIEAVESDDPELQQLLTCLKAKLEQDGALFSQSESNRFMIHPLSLARVLWDFLLTAVCCNIAISLPFSIAWENELSCSTLEGLATLDRAVNYFFIFDIILNFRTGFFNPDGKLIMDWRVVAHTYIRTWFLFDLISSLPTSEIEALSIENLQALKVLKLSKLFKIVRLVAPRNVDISELSETLDDIVQSKFVQHIIFRKSRVFFYMFLLSHWMASGMKMVDSCVPGGECAGWLSNYRDVRGHLWSEYLVALYWAMTTLTTVGYGDIIPFSDAERAYTIVAMIVGGGFYAYVVGAITSIVSNSDLNEAAYHERMDLIHAWLNHHHLPVAMKRTLRRYFKSFLAEKSAISEAQVFQDLSHELQREVGEYLIHEDVKNNPLFDGIGIGSVVQMQSILRRVTLQAGDCVATGGEVGMAMYILVAGSLEMTGLASGSKSPTFQGNESAASWVSSLSPARDSAASKRSHFSNTSSSKFSSSVMSWNTSRSPIEERKLEEPSASGTSTKKLHSVRCDYRAREVVEGQCFGEEILLGFTEYWEYTVTATGESKVEMIQQREFFNVFRTMPNVLEKIRTNFLLLNPEWKGQEGSPGSPKGAERRAQLLSQPESL